MPQLVTDVRDKNPITIVAVSRRDDPSKRVVDIQPGHVLSNALLEAAFVRCEKLLEKLK